MRVSFSLLSLSLILIVLVYTVGCVFAYLYPMAYSEQIILYAEKYNVESALIASVINTESNFAEDAVSNKGAIGLMQIMPSTAKWVASSLGKDYKEDYLLDAEYNIEIGTYYISYLEKYFGNEELALCAYNAGQGNVKSWLSDKEYSKDGKTLDKIPYQETENYLNKVFKNYHYYKNKYK